MDDKNDGKYARAPTVEDLIFLCKRLNEEGVSYILIGGFAVILHGFTRGTKYIDLLVDSDIENIRKIKRAMALLPDNAIADIMDDDIANYQVVRVADEFVVDLMERACGISYKDAEKDIEWMTIEGVKIPIASKELLIKMKDTFRPTDLMDRGFLKRLIEGEEDV